MNGTTRSISSLNPSGTHTISLERTGSDVEYQFAVSGTVIRSHPSSIDRVHGRRVLGTAGSGVDRYRYTGDVTALAVTNGSPDDLIVRVDGVRRSVSNFPSHPTA
ncbi:hypothetical protein [Halalkalicoccus salilacus]|uniref:hypothetical protein n=1 Tax=Halalkalicoccus salilacus TaxID=3117459 RepID=UPI00300ED0C5